MRFVEGIPPGLQRVSGFRSAHRRSVSAVRHRVCSLAPSPYRVAREEAPREAQSRITGASVVTHKSPAGVTVSWELRTDTAAVGKSVAQIRCP